MLDSSQVWRHAVRARLPVPDGDVLAELDEMTRRLQDAGLAKAAEMVRAATVQAQTDPARAAGVLEAAAALVAAAAAEARRSD